MVDREMGRLRLSFLRWRMLILLLAAVFVGTLAVPVASASASASHTFAGTFGSETSTPADPYPIVHPTDVEVDQTTHDIYVTDPSNHRIEKFDSSGNFILMFGKRVDKTKVEKREAEEAASEPITITADEEDLCTTASGDVCQPGVSASTPGAFEDPTYLAVDNYPGGEGDIYVADDGDDLVQKFDSSGHVLLDWGTSGQKDGSDNTQLPGFGSIVGLAVGGACADLKHETTQKSCVADGELFVVGIRYNSSGIAYEYNRAGEFVRYGFASGNPWLKVDPSEDFYSGQGGFFGQETQVYKTVQTKGTVGEGAEYQMTTDYPTEGLALDPSTEELYQDVGTREGVHGPQIDHYSGDCEPVIGPCEPLDSFGSGDLHGARGVAVDGTTHAVYVANSSTGDVAVFEDRRPIVATGPQKSATSSEVTLTGHVDPDGRGNITSCRFEYGPTKTYGKVLPCSPEPSSSATEVTAAVTGLTPGTREHYRLVAGNANGSFSGADETLASTTSPAIDGLAAEKLTATTAELTAQVDPNGLPTTYKFEYGLSTNYGQTVTGTLNPSNNDQPIVANLTGLAPHSEYHYRLVAENAVQGKEEGGTTTTEDHTFNFYPPSCPNENVRQQTTANYLPDCRAYELVSPGDAGGTQLYPAGPNTGHATNPSRFSYTGLWSTIPNSGGSPIDSNGDLYVATRTDTGWITKYVGLPSSEAAVDGGPPQGLFGQGGPQFLGNNTSIANGDSGPDQIQNNDFTDPAMDTFLDWNDGSQEEGEGRDETPIASNAPYVWSANGGRLDRWPTNLGSVPPGVNPTLASGVSKGGIASMNCTVIHDTAFFNDAIANNCPGEVTASGDLSHFVFSTEWNQFAPGGTLNPPGSVYDNNTAARTVSVASKTTAGAGIPSEPGDQTGDPLQVPGVSENGSHILIAAPGTGGCGLANCPSPPCGDTFGGKVHCPTYTSDLYMRVDESMTFDVSQGHDVNYVGMTEDGSKVYFTSAERLTPEDKDGSVDLYMWSESGELSGHPLTLISKGDNSGNAGEPGNSDSCNASFVSNCGVLTYSELSFCQLRGGEGGNCRSDNSIAGENGDIYFLSPEQLDGTLGVPNNENLYDYRNGHVQFVASLDPEQFCLQSPVQGFTDNACSSSAVARMQVSPDDSHMAFATASPVGQYNNNGRLEMYLYNPATERLVCASCIPSGAPPNSDIVASQDGLFMTNDGRVFFTTEDALVHSDTNKAQDVYEYVNGHPQLITTGTGETSTAHGLTAALENPPGLVGVSADGRDVYFSTYDTLVPEDHNGLFLKFYDARAGGGFPAPAPPPPCEAADECHGPGSSPPSAIPNETGANLIGGNARANTNSKGHKKAKRHRQRRRNHRRSARGRGGRGNSR